MDAFKFILLVLFVSLTIYSLLALWVKTWDLERRIEMIEKELGIKNEY